MTALDHFPELQKASLFSGLTEKQMGWLRNRLYVRLLPADKELIVSGAPGDVLYLILAGTVKVYIPQVDGSEVIVAILGPGDPVGEMSLIDQGGRSADVITLEETMVAWLSGSHFKEALQSMPILAENLIRILSNRLRLSTSQIQALASLNVDRRIVWQLLAFADRYGKPDKNGGTNISIRLTQTDLAGLVGASRKRVNQAIVMLKRSGWLSIDEAYHITILDRAALEQFLTG